jgi:replicative DNA helicase
MNNVLPHDVEAERSVLGALVSHNEALHKALEMKLEARDFYADSHQKLYEIILYLFERNQPIDLITLASQLKDRGWYEQVGGSVTLTEIFQDCFSVGHIAAYVEIIKNKAILRRIINTTSEITAKAVKGVSETEPFLDEIERMVFEISESKSGSHSTSLRDIFFSNLQTIENMALRKSDVIGLPTGFRDFDRLTGGLRGGQLMILAARPSMGKTSMFLSICQNVVTHDPKAVVQVFSLEMSKDELGFRLLSGSTKIPASKIKVGNLSTVDWPKLLNSSNELSASKIQIDDSAGLSVLDIKARCRRILAKEKRLDLIVVDYLQLMKGSKASQRGDSTREREVSEISRSLKSLSKELKVPVIALSQLNRSLENRPNKRPLLSDLRESGSIEADADIVAFIHREEVYNKETEDKGIAELILAKHRAGPTGTVRLGWLPEYTLFTNLESQQVRRLAVPIVAS